MYCLFHASRRSGAEAAAPLRLDAETAPQRGAAAALCHRLATGQHRAARAPCPGAADSLRERKAAATCPTRRERWSRKTPTCLRRPRPRPLSYAPSPSTDRRRAQPLVRCRRGAKIAAHHGARAPTQRKEPLEQRLWLL
eukprot:6195304-Pleurochrysis_carterae.AAC.3